MTWPLQEYCSHPSRRLWTRLQTFREGGIWKWVKKGGAGGGAGAQDENQLLTATITCTHLSSQAAALVSKLGCTLPAGA